MTLSITARRDEIGLKDGLLLIDGEWRAAEDGAMWTHVHPATGEEVGQFAVATPADVDRAVRAARRAFDEGPWPRMRAGERTKVLLRIADAIRANGPELAALLALDNSIPLSFGSAYALSAEVVADIFEHHAGWIDKLGGETLPAYQGGDHLVMTLREPVGVVGAVIPWNAPLMLFAQKVAPALAAGCTVVLKPSEFATFCVLRIAQILEETGLPPGVLNVVTGPGNPTGEALITHPGIDKLTFTGSRAVGERVAAAAAVGVRHVSLELGGKSPGIVFPDAPDVAMAAMTLMGMMTMGLSGQGCVCHSRALVHRDVYDDFINAAASLTGMITYGDPFDMTTTSAPLINAKQLEKVTGLIAQGQAEGARLVCGGDRPGGDLANGNYVNPTLFADVDNSIAIARQEIFGPVLAVIPFADEAEALKIANDTDYGLGATVYTTDIKRAFRVARAVRAGTFGINGYNVEPHAPFGGYKASGLGREGGIEAIKAFTEVKTVMVPTTDEMI
ncbi:MAG: aldehyde dehydrogenase family protein [Actinomycetes bacterium]